MLRHVARFGDLKGSDRGLPDSELPGHYKKLFNIVGFRQPDDPAMTSPLGNDLLPAIPIAAGFGVSFIEGIPGNGPVMHVHDTNESFMPLTGAWRIIWEDAIGHTEEVDLAPLDFVSIPAGVPRRFENVTAAPDGSRALMLGIVAGDAPQQEPTAASREKLERFGRLPPLVASTEIASGGDSSRERQQSTRSHVAPASNSKETSNASNP
jgi:mannose-6-phosphate isomerase-like protein (cupin superfamily)